MEAMHRFARRGLNTLQLPVVLLLMVLVWFGTPAPAMAVVTVTNCTVCHGSDVVAKHHQTTYFTSGQCNVCHTGITTTGTCSGCHNFNLANNLHHVPAAGTQLNCASCHTNTTDLTNCLTCHAGKVRLPHHQIAAAGTQCKSCHTTMTATQVGAASAGTLSCASCHTSKTEMQDRHHAKAKTTPIACTSCHTQIKDASNCFSCHTQGSKRAVHHATTNPAFADCQKCHSALPPTVTLSGGCTSCHAAGDNRTFHHTTVQSTKGLNCSQCHSTLPPTVTLSGGCNSCHASGDNLTLHHVTVKNSKNLSCNSCHTQMTASTSGDCRACHTPAKLRVPTVLETHHNSGLACLDCHTYNAATYAMLMPNSAQCAACHSQPGMPAIVTQHHSTPAYTAGNCAACHTGVGTNLTCGSCHTGTSGTLSQRHHNTIAPSNNMACADCHTGVPTNLSCSACHSSSNGTLAQRHHNTIGPANNKGCNDCHSNASTVLADCKSCHTTKVSTASIPLQHHMRGQASNIACTTCHTGAMTGNMDCASCHYAKAGTATLAPRHHATPAGQMGQCVSCHTGTEAVKIACASCHVSKKHHTTTKVDVTNCGACHTGIQLQGGSCKGCHTAPIAELHHGAPLAERDGNCAACHQAASDPTVCANCHSGTDPHHTTTFSKTGDCAHCHTVPASAMDRPKQAACRQCHGQYMHNKGGPIQNYGACAACHTTTTFHAAPGQPMGYTWMKKSGSTYPTGKGVFSMFWNQYTRGGQDEIRENISPNGEDMNDEGGRRWSRPTATFSLKAISNTATGKSYQVPSFDGYPIPGGTAPPTDPVLVNGNLALNKPSSASRQESGYESFRAFDADSTSYWWARSTSEQWIQVDLGSSQQINYITLNWHLSNYARSYKLEVSTTGSSWTEVVSKSSFSGGKIEHTFSARSARYVRLRVSNAANSNGYMLYGMKVFNNTSTTNPPPTTVSNLALNKTASASRQESGYAASSAVDGNASSRWWAKSSYTQWLRVDLGSSTSVSKVVIDWHSYYAREFSIQVSTDGSNWTTAKSVTSASGGTQTHTFSARNARYVRINCTRAYSSNGYSIEELEVYAQ
ncbi:MAG: galactose-binding domain-containing protein [Trichloromonadaceae bacterium]